MAGSMFSVDGLVSGMNTSAIISQLMSIERQPMVSLQDKRTKANGRLSTLQDLASRVSSLRSAARALTYRDTIAAKSATTNTPTNQAAQVTATVGSGAALGSFQVSVSRLATATRVMSSQAIGQPINVNSPLAQAGFGTIPTNGTFSINGKVITVDSSTVLSDGVDAAGSNTILAKINNAGANVTATLENDAFGRPNLLKLTAGADGKIQLGSGADTSNFLQVSRLLDAPVVGKTAATVTGSTVSAGAIASTTMVINGVTITTTATNSANTAAENAASIAADISAATKANITAVGMPNGTIVLTQMSLGSQNVIDISNAGTGTGLSVGVTANGTDDTVVSTSPLGTVQAGDTLTAGRFATSLVEGQGSFTINGVEIQYDTTTDTLNSVLSRINSKGTGVQASYDPVLDRVRLTATQMGSTAIALSDTTGNFLAATGLLNAAQVPGQNAVYSISSVNGGQPLTSSSNTVTGVLPGVALNLQSVTDSPVTVTVQMNADATVKSVRDFIDKYNSTLSFIRDQTSYDATSQTGGILMGDSTVRSLEDSLQSLMSTIPSGLSGGTIKTFADVGITTGAVGSAVGTTGALTLDENKLRSALSSNSEAVAALFTATATGALQGGGTGSLSAIKGSPVGAMQDGTWQVTSDGTGKLSAVFVSSTGNAGAAITGTITAGGSNSTLIPGLTLYAKDTLTAGTDTIAVNSQPRGLGVRLRDFLDSLVSTTGTLTKRENTEQDTIKSLKQQIDQMQQRLDDKEQNLREKFAKVEAAMAQVKTQGNQLASILGGMG